MLKKIKKRFFIFLVFFMIIHSCSLNYDSNEEKFNTRPNFIFENSTLDRYEENTLALRVKFNNLEIYDKDKIWAGEKIYFLKMDINQKPSETEDLPVVSKGFAGLIQIDDKNNKYFLGNQVFFEDVKEKINIAGEAFFWDKQANILYSIDDGVVRVKKGKEFSIQGSGFIANTRTREFEFVSSIEGKIHTEKTEEENSQN